MSDIDYSYIKNIMYEINDKSHIRIEDIPEYKLYISQIEELFEQKLGSDHELEEDKKILSKTMIQNYIRDGLVMPPEGKSYNKNHIILLIFIYNLKSILSIKDIKKLLFPIIDFVGSDEQGYEKIEFIYRNYTQIREKCLDRYIENFTVDIDKAYDDFYNSIGNEEPLKEWFGDNKTLFVIFLLVLKADIYKKTAEYLVENNLPQP